MVNALLKAGATDIPNNSRRLGQDEPCVFIAEFKDRLIPLPEKQEILRVRNPNDRDPNRKYTRLDLMVFWAFDKDINNEVLVVWNNLNHNASDEFESWITVSNEEWRTTVIGSCAVRQFKNAKMAMDECLGEPNEKFVVLHEDKKRGWRRCAVHSSLADMYSVVEFIMSNDFLARKLGAQEHVRLPLPDWKDSIRLDSNWLSDFCPGLAKEEWPNPEEGEEGIPRVLAIGFISREHGMVIITYQQIGNVAYVSQRAFNCAMLEKIF